MEFSGYERLSGNYVNESDNLVEITCQGRQIIADKSLIVEDKLQEIKTSFQWK